MSGGKLKAAARLLEDVNPMEVSEKLLCLFSATVAEEDDRYLIEVPKREIETGAIAATDTYRVALISGEGSAEPPASTDEHAADQDGEVHTAPDGPQPPVEPGEIRYVEIEDLGKQGDGIARVERGYVIIIPGAEVGERVKIEISEVKSNFGVGEVID